jgi:tetratricopeptide (TPR) repeat protein
MAAAAGEYQDLIAKGRLYLKKGKPNQAQLAAQKALRLRPLDGAEALVLLAELAIDEGDADRASRLATKAAKLNPAYPDVYVVLGTVEQARGNSAKARGYFKRYLTLSPSGDHAKDVRAILKMVP